MKTIKRLVSKDYSDVYVGIGMVMNLWSNKTSQYKKISKNIEESNRDLELSFYHDTQSISKDMRKSILEYGK